MINRPLYMDRIMHYINTPFEKYGPGLEDVVSQRSGKMIMERLEKASILHRCSRYDLQGRALGEYQRLLQIHDNYPKYVLRTDAFASGNYQGIKTMHVADFLLSSEF